MKMIKKRKGRNMKINEIEFTIQKETKKLKETIKIKFVK